MDWIRTGFLRWTCFSTCFGGKVRRAKLGPEEGQLVAGMRNMDMMILDMK